MPAGDLQSNVATFPEAKQIGFLEFKVIEERHCVVRRLLEAKWAIGDVGGASVSLLFEGDDLSGLCQRWQDVAERRLDCGPSAMKQNQWWRVAMGVTVD